MGHDKRFFGALEIETSDSVVAQDHTRKGI